MKKKIAVVHTSLVLYDTLTDLFMRIVPDTKIINIIDDSLLMEVSANGKITPGIVNRMCKYFDAAASEDVDLIFNTCSSVGEAAEIAARTISVPVLRIDEAMAEEAIKLGRRIGVIATVSSTVEPSCNLIRRVAAYAGKEVEIVPYLVDGALDVLMREGPAKHNTLVRGTVKKCEKECDVIVLAQGSMVILLQDLKDIMKPILTSPELGVRRAAAMLGF